MSLDPPSSAAPDAFSRHLAQLLSIADLSGRLRMPEDESKVARDLVHLARLATSAERASLFQIENADAEDDEPLWVVRLARDVAVPDGVEPATPFQPRHVSLLLSVMQTGGVQAMGPVADGEPFYAQHRSHEPTVTRHAAFAPVLLERRAVGVLEVARSEDRPFSADSVAALDAGARAVAAAVFATRREQTVRSLLGQMIPELLEPGRAQTHLPTRLRDWLESRRMEPAERECIAIATTIAELSQSSAAARELVHSVLAAARKALLHDVPGWSEVTRAGR